VRGLPDITLHVGGQHSSHQLSACLHVSFTSAEVFRHFLPSISQNACEEDMHVATWWLPGWRGRVCSSSNTAREGVCLVSAAACELMTKIADDKVSLATFADGHTQINTQLR